MISPLPGVTHGKPGSAMIPIPGVAADVVTEEGESVPDGSGGYLVLTAPWPSMLRTIWGDDERFKDTYWSRYHKQGWYFAGDGAKKDEDGDLWVLGRVDDVMNVSGHRLSTTEIESALVSHPKVAEAAVVGAKDEDTGQAVCAFVILREEAGDGGEDIVEELRNHVRKEIGADRQAAPDHDRPRAAQDPLRQDHAPAAQGRRRAPRGRRRDHPGRRLGHGPDLGGDRQGQGRGLTVYPRELRGARSLRSPSLASVASLPRSQRWIALTPVRPELTAGALVRLTGGSEGY